MENIDQVPSETQKKLLRTLIQNIVIPDSKIVMNVYIRAKGFAEAPAENPHPD